MSVPPEPQSGLVREWAACGIVAAVSRFVPVPLLDDVVKERATRLAIARTLKAQGRGYDVTDVEVLYTGTDGWFAGARKYLVGVPARVVLFPVRKYVAVFGAVRGVPSDVMAVILLARTVHRSLSRGELASTDRKVLRRDARRVRKAYDTVFDEMDLRLLSGGLQDALSTGRNLSSAAADVAQRLLDHLPGRHRDDAKKPSIWAEATDSPESADSHDSHDPADSLDRGPADALDRDAVLDAEPELERGAEQVAEVLRRPEISALIEEFDHRVDAYLGV